LNSIKKARHDKIVQKMLGTSSKTKISRALLFFTYLFLIT
jgi:hypothetical protein